MITRALSIIDGLSKIFAYMTMAMTGALILVMSYEMFVRRVLNSPTLWAFDISYMLSGVIFVAAMAFTLLRNEHVRIDFLSVKMPVRVQHAVNVLFYVTLLLPAVYILSATAVSEAWEAYVTGQVERVSPWSPVIWPYYFGLAAGLVAFFLQIVAEVVRHTIKALYPETTENAVAGVVVT